MSDSPRPWQRFFLGYEGRFVNDCELPVAGVTLRLLQRPSASAPARGGKQAGSRSRRLDKAADPSLTGTTVWDGCVVLAQFLTQATSPLRRLREQRQQQQQPSLPQPPLQPRPAGRPQPPLTSIELGAGTGGVSLALLAARLVDRALITDLPDMLPHLSANIAHNSRTVNPAQAVVRALRWGEPADVAALGPGLQPPFRLIVTSDCIYYSYCDATPHSRLLLTSLVQLAGPESDIFLALSLHHNPDEVGHFLRWAEEAWGFSVARLQWEVPEEYRVPDVLVAHLRLVDAGKAAAAAKAAMAGELRRGY